MKRLESFNIRQLLPMMSLLLMLCILATPAPAAAAVNRLYEDEEVVESGTIERNYYWINTADQVDYSKVCSDRLVYEITDRDELVRTLYIRKGTELYAPGYYDNPECFEGRLVYDDAKGEVYVTNGNFVSPTYVHINRSERIGLGQSGYTTLQYITSACVIEEGVTRLPRFTFFTGGTSAASGDCNIRDFYLPDSLTDIDPDFMGVPEMHYFPEKFTIHCSSHSEAARFAKAQGFRLELTDKENITDIPTSKIHVGECIYTGNAQTPKVTIDGLAQGTDFTVTYSNNVDAGFGNAIIQGIGNYEGTRSVTFTIQKADPRLTLTADQQTLPVGSKMSLHVQGSQGQLSYSSSDTSIATVDRQGIVTGVQVGMVTLTASAEETRNYRAASASLNIQVTESSQPGTPLEKQSLKVTADTRKMCPRDKVQIHVIGAEGKVTFKSSDKTIATCNSQGIVTAKKIGTIKITVRAAATDAYKAAKKTLTLTIVPTNTEIRKLTSPAAGQVKLTWNKNLTCDRYEIQLATSKTFKSTKKVIIKKNTTTSQTIKKLKKAKKYYVRIRCTDTSGELYSKWSATKTIKTK